MTQREVRLVGVCPGVLQRVGRELRVEPDATAFLPQVEQVAAGSGNALDGLAQLRTAVTPLAAEYVAGQALAVRADQRHVAIVGGERRQAGAEREREVLPTVDEPVEAEGPRVRHVSVRESQRQLDLGADRRDGE